LTSVDGSGYKIKRVSISPPAAPVELPDSKMDFPVLPKRVLLSSLFFESRKTGKAERGDEGQGVMGSDAWESPERFFNGMAVTRKIHEEG
jgi:hypothetical protein